MLEGYSRAMVAGAVATGETAWAALTVLYTAARRSGVPETLISDHGGAFISNAFEGLDHGVGHFRPLSLTRQRHLLAYHGIAMSHEGMCQVF